MTGSELSDLVDRKMIVRDAKKGTICWASFRKRPTTIFAQSPVPAASCLVGTSGALLITADDMFVGSIT